MRKLAFMAVSVLTLALAACTTSSTPPARHRSTGLIAWTSTPAPPTTSSTTTTTTLAPAPLCTKADLQIGPPVQGAATGHIGVSFRLTNIGKATCRLEGYPGLFAITQAGKRAAVPVHRGTFFINAVPGNLSPKASGYFVIASSSFCLGEPAGSAGGLYPVHYRQLIIHLPDGTSVVTAAKSLYCGPLEVSQVGVQPQVPGELPPPEPGTTAFLQVSVHLPAHIVGGRVLDYIVELANPGSRPIALQSCPGYSETLAGLMSKTAFQRSYELNCRAVGQIGPHKTVGFEMEIPVPKVSKPAEAKFVWLLDTAYHQGWGHPIRVYP
jgi:hypothetical protein